MATTSKAEEINILRNRAILNALDHALRLADPEDENVRIRPFAPLEEEQALRKELAPYVMSWIVGPLTDALRQRNLGDYRHVCGDKAQQYMEDLDGIGA